MFCVMRAEWRYVIVVGRETSTRRGRNFLPGSLWTPSLGHSQLLGPVSRRAVLISLLHDHPPPLENSSAVPFTEAGFHSMLGTEAWELSATASSKSTGSCGSQKVLILWIYHGSIYPGHAGAAGPTTTLIIKDLPYHPDSIIHSLDTACARTLKINIKVINGNSTQIGMVKRKKLLEQTNGKPKDDSRFSSMQKPKLCK